MKWEDVMAICHQQFIGVYQMDIDICDNLVDYYHENPDLHRPGETGAGINRHIKDSKDLTVPHLDRKLLDERVVRYLNCLEKDMAGKYIDQFPTFAVAAHNHVSPFNIQKYPKGGGFSSVHCERAGGAGQGDYSFDVRRVLVWMTYLCDIEEGGGTRFNNQGITVPCKKGLTVLWPSEWTHMHHGIVAPNDEKILVTGWFTL